ncbi:MAG: hypothetical protein OFPI_41560 [Osedax symbiont Rs2]|nr:MAG: hypothetical protein OFPI_41560 [Osedax symbiont Rs2]
MKDWRSTLTEETPQPAINRLVVMTAANIATLLLKSEPMDVLFFIIFKFLN